MTTEEQPKRRKGRGQGFASMSPERRSELARLGGIAAHELGTAHVFSSEEAVSAGRKGGSISRRGPVRRAQS